MTAYVGRIWCALKRVYLPNHARSRITSRSVGYGGRAEMVTDYVICLSEQLGYIAIAHLELNWLVANEQQGGMIGYRIQ